MPLQLKKRPSNCNNNFFENRSNTNPKNRLNDFINHENDFLNSGTYILTTTVIYVSAKFYKLFSSLKISLTKTRLNDKRL